jgi:uracil phosphoribosyltransferase
MKKDRSLIRINHPLIQRDLTILRDKRTNNQVFRSVLRRASSLIAYEVTRDLPRKQITISTPLERTSGVKITQPIILVPILRAGLGFVDGFIEVLPEARVGHVGLYRNEETLEPVDYYFRMPRNVARSLVIVLDPMLATGGSASAAINYLKRKGARSLRYVSLVSAPQGVTAIARSHPDVVIYTCALDRTLSKKGYILPGLGDAGDRIFGTE